MSDLFINIVNMSITASYVIIAVIILRFFLKKLPKKYSYFLWSVVGFRLCCPVSFKSIFSMFNLKLFDMSNIQNDSNALNYIQSSDGKIANDVNIGIQNTSDIIYYEITSSGTYKERIEALVLLAGIVWIIGIFAFLLYGIISYIRLARKLSTATKLQDNVFECENVSSPFIMGIIKPKIYIPYGLDNDKKEYVLAHEKYHIKRRDNIVKLFAFFVLTVHFFNPLCWLAFYLMSKDMEMSCDEAVLSSFDGIKKDYSTALLSFATGKKFPSPSPLSFSESGVKGRIKNVLSFKKPKVFISIISVVICVSLLVACASNPSVQKKVEEIVRDEKISIESNIDTAVSAAIINYREEHYNDDFPVEAHIILDTRDGSLDDPDNENCITVFLDTFQTNFVIKDGILETGYNTVFTPAAVTLIKEENDKYSYADVWYPGDGGLFVKDLEKYFTADALKAYREIGNSLSLREAAFATAIYQSGIDINAAIEKLLEKISNPSDQIVNASSNPGDYLSAAFEEHETLECYGDYTLKYIYSEFLKGNQTDLRGHIMKIIMEDLLGGEAIKYYAETGQEYFDAFDKHVNTLYEKNGFEFMLHHSPKGIILLEMEGVTQAIVTDNIDDLKNKSSNIGAEMPTLDYIDDNIAIINGTCGIVIFDINANKITERITADTLINMGFHMEECSVTPDGKIIYIRDDGDGADESLCYKFSVESKSVEKVDISEWEKHRNSNYTELNIYDEVQLKALGINDYDHLLSGNYIEYDNSIAYLKAENNWQMNTMQLIIKSPEKKTEIYLFR